MSPLTGNRDRSQTQEARALPDRARAGSVFPYAGHPELGKFLNDVDIYAECQACGAQALDLPDGLA